MNERLQELAEQATKHYPATETSGEFSIFDKAKFAELIVQECIDIIAPYSVRMSRPGEAYLHPIQEIKQHFGVEL